MITKTNIKEPVVQINEEKMSVYEMSRWFCLLEALDLITKKGQALKLDLVKGHKWVKPIALQKYIEERINSVVVDVEKEHIDGKI
tara:strand:+ start:183 stop:437 length:255 start_codon:yes stop_codon:yes gene_type:complete